jgi:SNF2 family DNA or RNA helicase
MTTQTTLWKQSAKPWKPHGYQLKAVKFLLQHAGAGLFLDPGLGKTSIVLSALRVLLKEKMTSGAIVIAPLRVCHSVWPREVEKWEEFSRLKVNVLHGKGKELRASEKADIYVINPEGLEWLVTSSKLAILLKNGVDTLVVDELSKFKHSKTRRFKILKPFLEKFARRWGLTGSPAPNGLMDLFGQAFILDSGRSLGRYITHYRMQYFNPTGFGGYTWVLRPGAAEAIYERLKPLVLRMDAKDYLDLPERLVNIIRVELPESVMVHYKAMEDDAFAMLEGETHVTAASAAAAMNKCSQIANGGVYLDPTFDEEKGAPLPREIKELHTAKVEALSELVEELQGTPLLVAYEFRHDLARILQFLGPNTPYIGGGVSTKRAAELERAWNAGELPILLGHPASIGHGLNLQGANAHNVCFFGITWDYELYDQFIRRLLRQGNTAKRVIVHHIVARDTVDEAKLKALRKKKHDQGALLDALNEYRKGG